MSTAVDKIGLVAGFRLHIGGGNVKTPLSVGNGSGLLDDRLVGYA